MQRRNQDFREARDGGPPTSGGGGFGGGANLLFGKISLLSFLFFQVENADEGCGLKTKRTENLILAIYIAAILFLFPVITGAAHARTGSELRKNVAEAKRMRRRIRLSDFCSFYVMLQ